MHHGPGGQPLPKLLDFGVAKLIGDELPLAHRTRTGEALGTPHYMSPEQCVGGPVDHRADLYAYGVLMYRCVTGGLPFKSRSVIELLHDQVTTPPRDPRQLAPQLGDRTALHLLRCLAKQPEDRPETAAAALDGLFAAAQADREHPPEPRPEPARDPHRSQRRAVWGGAALALGLVAWAVWTVVTPPRAPQSPPSAAPRTQVDSPKGMNAPAASPPAPPPALVEPPPRSPPPPIPAPSNGTRPPRTSPNERGADDVEEWR